MNAGQQCLLLKQESATGLEETCEKGNQPMFMVMNQDQPLYKYLKNNNNNNNKPSISQMLYFHSNRLFPPSFCSCFTCYSCHSRMSEFISIVIWWDLENTKEQPRPYLWGGLQKGLTEEERPTLNVGWGPRLNKKERTEAAGRAQWLRAPAVFPKDQSSGPNTYIRWPTAGIPTPDDTLFWPLWVSACMCAHNHINTQHT